MNRVLKAAAGVAVAGACSLAVVVNQAEQERRAANPPPPKMATQEAVDEFFADLLVKTEAYTVERARAAEADAFHRHEESVAAAWTPSADSPLALLPLTEATKYLPTQANLREWMDSVEQLRGREIVWTDDLEYVWGLCLEQQALRAFIINHQTRESARWEGHEQSVSLETELQPVRSFMDRHLGYDDELWQLVSHYSDDVATQLRGEGDLAEASDDAQSRWDLYRALVAVGQPSFDAVALILQKD